MKGSRRKMHSIMQLYRTLLTFFRSSSPFKEPGGRYFLGIERSEIKQKYPNTFNMQIKDILFVGFSVYPSLTSWNRLHGRQGRNSTYMFCQFSVPPFAVLILIAESRTGAAASVTSSTSTSFHFCCDPRKNHVGFCVM